MNCHARGEVSPTGSSANSAISHIYFPCFRVFRTLLLNLRLLQNLHNHGYLLPPTARIFRRSETSSQLPVVHPSASDVQHPILPFRNLPFPDWSAPNTLLVHLLRTAIHKVFHPLNFDEISFYWKKTKGFTDCNFNTLIFTYLEQWSTGLQNWQQ
ncbi:hypothetical protein Tsp_13016 [Trichinella spiralis]|uniref:hypothetical protein n=1 Tax=Trichinella spiralis TaxID=6334 RepID=UPI0001EFDA63|nr:hypothetical protein Tsp_13016 [Trichinella spiralis]